jgi:MarR family transcriptional regulator, 2-MHQ and catechol-resistance regulon repressor
MAATPDAPTRPTEVRPPCGIDDERILTFGLLLEAHTRLTRLLDAELQRTDGISLQTYEVLLRVSRSPGGYITMSDLADAVALTTGGITRLADRLEADGLVARRSCPSDRRKVHLTLTERGARVLAAATEHHLVSLEEHVTSRLSPEDLAVLHRVLDDLRTDPST